MAFNRIVDRSYDAANPRTAGRELPAGRLTPRQAWGFYFACAGAFLAAAWMFYALLANPWPAFLALPMLAALSAYSLLKRASASCHLALGAALGLAPPAAWLAVAPQTFGPAALVLAAAVE